LTLGQKRVVTDGNRDTPSKKKHNTAKKTKKRFQAGAYWLEGRSWREKTIQGKKERKDKN